MTVPRLKEGEPYKIIYDRSRFPILQRRPDGKWGCRGCGGEIPKGRTAWCSKNCSDRYNPASVIYAVKRRDNGICAVCLVDIGQQLKDWNRAKFEACNGERYDYALNFEWEKKRPPIAEYDHIIPFSEGGLTVLENMRTLCSVCHKARTAKWHKERAIARRYEGELL